MSASHRTGVADGMISYLCFLSDALFCIFI